MRWWGIPDRSSVPGDRGQLVVGSGQHGLFRPGHAVVMALDEGGDHSLGFFPLVVVGDHARLRPVGDDRPGLVAAMVTEGGVGHGHDLGSRAVVVGQLEDGDGAEELAQPVEQRGVGTVPSVDGLMGITDHAEVPRVAEQGPDQPELGGVHVLELVDGEVTVSPSHALGEALVIGQQVGCSDQQVVEVEAVPLGEGRLVGAESLDHRVGVNRTCVGWPDAAADA